jgi:hypothetical protein
MTTSLRSVFAIDQVVNASAVAELRRHVRGMTLAPRRLDLDCGTVHSMDPVGAALLWLLCVELERSVGTHVRLVNLPVPVLQRLRSHPLNHYVVYGDDMFQDPFNAPLPSNR